MSEPQGGDLHPCDDCTPLETEWTWLEGCAYVAVEAVNPDGSWSYWLRLPEPQPQTWHTIPAHEKTGRLPKDWRVRVWGDRLRCGRPTRNGLPCRVYVARAGEACGAHRESVTERAADDDEEHTR